MGQMINQLRNIIRLLYFLILLEKVELVESVFFPLMKRPKIWNCKCIWNVFYHHKWISSLSLSWNQCLNIAFRALHVDQSKSDSVHEVLFVKGKYWQKIYIQHFGGTFFSTRHFPSRNKYLCYRHNTPNKSSKVQVNHRNQLHTNKTKKHAYLIYICCLRTTKYLA